MNEWKSWKFKMRTTGILVNKLSGMFDKVVR